MKRLNWIAGTLPPSHHQQHQLAKVAASHTSPNSGAVGMANGDLIVSNKSRARSWNMSQAYISDTMTWTNAKHMSSQDSASVRRQIKADKSGTTTFGSGKVGWRWTGNWSRSWSCPEPEMFLKKSLKQIWRVGRSLRSWFSSNSTCSRMLWH